MTDETFEDHLEAHQRDGAKESQILLWIWNSLDEISCLDYEQYLRDGAVLCRLMNIIKPGSIKGEISTATLKDKRNNIERFTKACSSYGVPKELIFNSEDLLYLRHIPRVTRCMFALGKKTEDDEDYEGAELGEEPYDPVGKAGRRRGGLPLGDDILVAHINIGNITNVLLTPPKEEKKRISLFNF